MINECLDDLQSKRILDLIKKSASDSGLHFESKANCFNAVQYYFGDNKQLEFTGPEDFLLTIQSKFIQISSLEGEMKDDVLIVWSRSTDLLPVGDIKIDNLYKKNKGYPFGLIMEHAFVLIELNSDMIFQKRDQEPSSPYEIVCRSEALFPYLNCFGFELTKHRRKIIR